ncbi:MAG: galactokinase [Oscillospiraceae bacterium]|nr:galactokinase [Oscillospiraceae bacterium]
MNIPAWLEKISSGEQDAEFSALYGDCARARARHQRLLGLYRERFGDENVILVSAPGRTELAGNHTDHQQGMVLCGSVTQDTLAVAAPAADGAVTILSEGFGEFQLKLDSLLFRPEERESSAAIVRGMAAALSAQGVEVGGFRAVVNSDVPAGGGLSSSASFEVLVGAIFCALYGGRLSPMGLAKAGQTAERDYFGKPSGLLDQAACAGGGILLIDFYDPLEPRLTPIAFDFRKKGYVLCAVDTHTSHAGLTEDYAAIPRDMRAVAWYFHRKALRYVDRSLYLSGRSGLEGALSPLAIGRAEHFFAEEERVTAMAQALLNGDMETYRRKMIASGESSRFLLQNIVPPSQPERREMAIALDRAESLLNQVGAWRIHGGGFAGCIQCLVPEAAYPAFVRAMDGWYGEGSTFELRIRPCGAHLLKA